MRQGAKSLLFLRDNLVSTDQLASGVGSNDKTGLTLTQAMRNGQQYGYNGREKPVDDRCYQLREALRSELLNIRSILFGLLWVVSLILECLWGWVRLQGHCLADILIILAVVAIRTGLKWRTMVLENDGYPSQTSRKFYVCREGCKHLIAEEEIRVGDILHIDFN